MELTAGYPYFLIKNGLLYGYPKINSNEKTEVLIIGGGISGALSAYACVEAGLEVILVDSRSIGLGSTCASTSLLQYELDIPLHQLKEKIGVTAAESAYRLCGDAIGELIDIMQKTGFGGFEKNSSLFFTTHSKEKDFIQTEWAARRDAGFEVNILTATEMKERYGLIAEFGILSELAASIDTYALTHHLLQYSMKKGLQVYDRSKVVSMDHETNSVRVKMENGFTVNAGHVINATGYEVVNFIERDIVNFDCTYAIASENLEEGIIPWKEKVLFWNTDDPYVYIRSTLGNRILAGGRDEPFSNEKTREDLLDKKASALQDDLATLIPGLTFKTEFAWSGTFGKTKDSLSYIGYYRKTPRVLYSLGFGGNGITFSQVAANINRDLICKKKNPAASIFSFDR